MKDNLPAISLVLSMVAIGSSGVTLMQAKDRTTSSPPASTIAVEHGADVASLHKALQQQRTEFESFRQTFRSLLDSGALSGRNRFIGLDVASKSYGRVDTENGFLLVSCQDIRPFLDGHKAILHVGNPLGVRFVGFKITARWGARYTGANDDYEAYSKWMVGLRSKETSFTNALESGRWNEVEMVLPQTTASQVGYIQVSIDTDTVSMLVPRK